MKFSFWNKVKNSYNQYKFNKKYSQLLITVLFIIILIIEIVLVIIGKILAEFFRALQEWDEQRRIENRIRHQRQMELRRIYEENKAAGYGFQSGITESKYQTKMKITEQNRIRAINRRNQKDAETYLDNFFGSWRWR